ncbi:MAG: DUF5658 family protein [Paenisporosarcina sp.]
MIVWIWFLISLNVIDGVATYYGIKASLITEVNPLMAQFDPLIILLIKILLSTLLISLFLSNSSLLVNRFIKKLLIFANICYIFVFGLHVYWIILV